MNQLIETKDLLLKLKKQKDEVQIDYYFLLFVFIINFLF